MADPTHEPSSLRLPCACGAVLEGVSGGALLDAVEAHIAAAHERRAPTVGTDDRHVDRPTNTKGR